MFRYCVRKSDYVGNDIQGYNQDQVRNCDRSLFRHVVFHILLFKVAYDVPKWIKETDEKIYILTRYGINGHVTQKMFFDQLIRALNETTHELVSDQEIMDSLMHRWNEIRVDGDKNVKEASQMCINQVYVKKNNLGYEKYEITTAKTFLFTFKKNTLSLTKKMNKYFKFKDVNWLYPVKLKPYKKLIDKKRREELIRCKLKSVFIKHDSTIESHFSHLITNFLQLCKRKYYKIDLEEIGFKKLYSFCEKYIEKVLTLNIIVPDLDRPISSLQKAENEKNSSFTLCSNIEQDENTESIMLCTKGLVTPSPSEVAKFSPQFLVKRGKLLVNLRQNAKYDQSKKKIEHTKDDKQQFFTTVKNKGQNVFLEGRITHDNLQTGDGKTFQVNHITECSEDTNAQKRHTFLIDQAKRIMAMNAQINVDKNNPLVIYMNLEVNRNKDVSLPIVRTDKNGTPVDAGYYKVIEDYLTDFKLTFSKRYPKNEKEFNLNDHNHARSFLNWLFIENTDDETGFFNIYMKGRHDGFDYSFSTGSGAWTWNMQKLIDLKIVDPDNTESYNEKTEILRKKMKPKGETGQKNFKTFMSKYIPNERNLLKYINFDEKREFDPCNLKKHYEGEIAGNRSFSREILEDLNMGGFEYNEPGKAVQLCGPLDGLEETGENYIFHGEIRFVIKYNPDDKSNRGSRPNDTFLKWSPTFSVTCELAEVVKVGLSTHKRPREYMNAYEKSQEEQIKKYLAEEESYAQKEELKNFTPIFSTKRKKDVNDENKDDAKRTKVETEPVKSAE